MTTDPVEVRLIRRFNAPADRVFDSWLDPAMIGLFMFGPHLRDEEILHLTLDPKVGGEFSFAVRRGDELIDHVGTYREIVRPRRLVFTWGVKGESEDESVVSIDIVSENGFCELSLAHRIDEKWADYAERVEESWSRMLSALDTALEGY